MILSLLLGCSTTEVTPTPTPIRMTVPQAPPQTERLTGEERLIQFHRILREDVPTGEVLLDDPCGGLYLWENKYYLSPAMHVHYLQEDDGVPTWEVVGGYATYLGDLPLPHEIEVFIGTACGEFSDEPDVGYLP